MTNYLRAGLFAVFSVSVGVANAQTTDGNSLLEACNAAPEQGLQAFCIGYILGAWEGMNWGGFRVWVSASPDSETAELNSFVEYSLGVCAPSEVQNGQVVDVVRQYLEEHPEERHQAARGLINIAMATAFPCSSSE
jgi:hypothetical protein